MLLLGVVGSDQQSVFVALFNDDDVVKFWVNNQKSLLMVVCRV